MLKESWLAKEKFAKSPSPKYPSEFRAVSKGNFWKYLLRNKTHIPLQHIECTGVSTNSTYLNSACKSFELFLKISKIKSQEQSTYILYNTAWNNTTFAYKRAQDSFTHPPPFLSLPAARLKKSILKSENSNRNFHPSSSLHGKILTNQLTVWRQRNPPKLGSISF